jgi:hypothetical protein
MISLALLGQKIKGTFLANQITFFGVKNSKALFFKHKPTFWS